GGVAQPRHPARRPPRWRPPAAAGGGPPPQDNSAFLGGIRVAGQVSLRGATIARDLVLYSAVIQCGLRCGAARTQRTRIDGDALLGAARVAFGVDFSGARIQGDLNLEDAV